MLLGNIYEEFHPDCRASYSAPHLSSSLSIRDTTRSPTTPFSMKIRTSMESPQSMMNYARMSYRYTTVTLLSMRPQPDVTVFPDHLVERRFLDNENYIDLDRMLAEKGGKFRMNLHGMYDGAGDGPIVPTRIHKYDFSDPAVIERVKNRRPKDPLTPHQVAALTSVVTRHQSSTFPTPLSSPHHTQASPIWIDDYNCQRSRAEGYRQQHHLPIPPTACYQRHGSNQVHPLLPNHQPNLEQNINTVPILQRLFQAQKRQQHEQHHNPQGDQPSSPYIRHRQNLSTFAMPTTTESSIVRDAFAWPFSMGQPQQTPATHPLQIPMSSQTTVKTNQNVLSRLINERARCSTTIQTPITPNMNADRMNTFSRDKNNDDDDDDDDQKYYSAPPSPTKQQDELPHCNKLINQNNAEHARVCNQAVLLNSLIRNMINDTDVTKSSSNESCLSSDTQTTDSSRDENESYAEMYNLVRLLSPGVKNIAQQELLQYLEQGCKNDRDETIRLLASLDTRERNSFKTILLSLINEQSDITKSQQSIHQGKATSMSFEHSQQARSTLESWFGCDIYKNSYPSMPSDRAISALDLEQSRLIP